MKKKILAMVLALAMVLTMLPMNLLTVNAVEIPEGAPFTALTTDAGDVTGIEDMGTVSYNGYGTYENVPYYHVTIPEGATEVYVTHPSSEDPFADSSYGSAYGYYASTEDWTGSGMSFQFVEAEDGYTITLPLSGSSQDWSTGETLEYSFVEDEEGYVSHAVAVERSTDFSPIAFFSFEYGKHTCEFGEWEETKVPTCTEAGEKTRSCSCGQEEKQTIAATGHNFVNGICSVCTEADPNYVAPDEGAVIPEGAPFTALTTDAGDVTGIEDMGTVSYNGYGTYENVPYYHVTIPEGATKVYVTHPSSEDPFADSSYGSAYGYYASTEDWTGSGMSFQFVEAEDGYTITLPLSGSSQDWSTGETLEYSFVADEEGYVSHAVAVERNDFSPIAFFSFEYGVKGTDEPTDPDTPVVPDTPVNPDEPDRTFTKIVAGDVQIEEAKISYKGIFELGDNPDGDADGYPYIHEVPYYIVEVPLGTKTVDITYKADIDIMNSEGNAYGYRTVISRGADSEVDGMSSATVKSTTFKGAYKVNEDGTRTVTTSVSNHTVDADGNRWAITLEEKDSPFKAVTLFSFDYPEHTHNYTETHTPATCTEEGYSTFTCRDCFYSYTQVEGNATGHEYESVVTAPTCTEDGYTTHTCENCGDSYTDTTVSKTGHTQDTTVEPVITAPTCTVNGYTTYTCATCKETYTEPIISSGHSMMEEVVPSKCNEQGYTRHYCKNCDHEYKDNYIELAEHNYVDGSCSDCGAPVAVEDVYQLGNAEHLKWFKEFVESGNTTAKAKLTADITVNAETAWDGIGTDTNKFAGTFDGAGHTITITNGKNGLFNYVYGTSSKRAEIKNVTIAGTINSGNSYIAGIAARVRYVNITDCVNNADIKGASKIGGIVAYGHYKAFPSEGSDVTITNCGNNGSIVGSGDVAGIIGNAHGNTKLVNCYNTGYVKGDAEVGGLIGYIQGHPNDCSATNCYNIGKIDASSNVGGLVGNMYNGVTLTNCYNTGECTNAIAGTMYNKTAKVINAYYLATASAQAAPANKIHENFSATPKTAVEMSSIKFAALLGEAFKQSCPAPVFTTQTAADHSGMEDGVCDVCNFGSNVKAEFTVTLPEDNRFTVVGEPTVTEGENYTFTIEFAEGYMAGKDFAVTATNYDVVDNGDGTYSVENVISDFAISVSGVVEAKFTVTLPGDGNGYRVRTTSSTTVLKGNDFSFTVSVVDKFEKSKDFAVKANGTKLPEVNGIYTISNVSADQTITVEGVAEEYCKPVEVTFTITKDTDELYKVPNGGSIMLFKDMEVPYFDLALYDLGKYYYNPYCYIDEDGIPRDLYKGGTRESANGVVTVMHAFIYATEVYYLGYDETEAGKGYSNTVDSDKNGITDFYDAISWNDQSAGSTFVSFWDHGTNLNYYVNYVYPLGILPEQREGKPGIGSTADQIKLKDGDIISMHHIVANKGSASGSNFPFFVVNDDNDTFDISAQDGTNTIDIYDTVDKATVTQGEKIELSLYVGLANYEKYVTDYVKQTGKQLYMIEADKLVAELEYIDEEDLEEGQTNVWTKTPYVTDEKGEVVIDTSDFAPGTYYIVADGGMTAGGQTDSSNGFVSAGGETGLAVLELTVKAPEACKVTIPVADEYKVNGETSVAYGSDYTFTVTISEGYEKGENFAVKVNGKAVEANEDGVYTVENVKTALEITVEGVVEKAVAPEKVYGDLDGDGELTYKEVLNTLAAFRNKAELTAEGFAAADIDGDGELEYIEVLTILKNFRAGE